MDVMSAINEIKTFDAKTGGDPRVVTIDKDAFKQLKRDEVVTLCNKQREIIASRLSDKFRITKERALALYPEP
jgi:hypothetical protein